jgi:hypothetical protein
VAARRRAQLLPRYAPHARAAAQHRRGAAAAVAPRRMMCRSYPTAAKPSARKVSHSYNTQLFRACHGTAARGGGAADPEKEGFAALHFAAGSLSVALVRKGGLREQ